MYEDLRGKAAVVTGSSKGLGTAIAERLASEGVSVVINYHSDREGAEEALRTVQSGGGKAVVVEADVSTEEGIERLKTAALDAFGRLDIWVNNAGKEDQVPTHEMPLETWQKLLNLDLTGVFLGSRCALRHFLENNVTGNIINMSSVHDIIPWPTFAHYAASKAGVSMFTKTIAMEYAARGIRVNALCPGAIETHINAEKFADPEQLAATKEMIPMRRIGQPEEVASAAAWLASDESRYVTGITLYVDGGMTLYPAFQEGKG